MKPVQYLILTLLAVIWCAAPSWAEFVGVATQEVPTARLIKNLESKLQKKPNDPCLLYALGRAHSIASVRETVPLEKEWDPKKQTWSDELGGPWFGRFAKRIAWREKKRSLQDDAAKQHLRNAIRYYEKSLLLDSENSLTKLGLAWAYEKEGQIGTAILLHREIIHTAWPKEKDVEYSPYMRGRYWAIVVESGEYLIKLLDPEKNRDEIAEVKRKIKQIGDNGKITAITPIILPLWDDTALEFLIEPDRAVRFDLDGRGARLWQWVSPTAGFLVYWEEERPRPITSGLQMFGNFTFWMFWESGYDALAALDDNGNGDLSGSELKGLAVWQDKNQNGISEEGEIRTLATLEIVRLGTSHLTHPSGIEYHPEGVVFADGSAAPSYDWVSTEVKQASQKEAR